MSIAESSDVDPTATIGAGTRVWHLAQVRDRAVIGADCIIGRGAYIGSGVRLGDRVKVQNLAQIYEPADVADGAFIGPGVIFTNDRTPRAVTPDGRPKTGSDWEAVGVTVHEGASIGAGAICVAPLTIGAWALVAAGSIVVRDVAPFSLVAGNPARRIGWVGRAGARLVGEGAGSWTCPVSGARYRVVEDALVEED